MSHRELAISATPSATASMVCGFPRSALAKAGKSVLLVDQEDTYGSEYASLTIESLRQAARGVPQPSLTAEQPQPPQHGGDGVTSPDPGAAHGNPPCERDGCCHEEPLPMLTTGTSATDEVSDASIGVAAPPPGGPAAHASEEAGPSQPPLTPPSPPPVAAARRVPRPPFRLPLHGVQHLALPGQEKAGKDDKAYILDLMPKVRPGADAVPSPSKTSHIFFPRTFSPTSALTLPPRCPPSCCTKASLWWSCW